MIGLPCPSQRISILVKSPPWLRPKASSSGVHFWPRLHVVGHAQCFHRQSGSPSPVRPVDRPWTAARPVHDPKCQPSASGESGCRRCSMIHIALVSLARVHQCAVPSRSHSPLSGDLCWDVPFGTFEEAKAVLIVPIVHSLSRLGSWRRLYKAASYFANKP